ncbi:hypothetical protein Q4595_09300 [Wenyingzhuangia sp. 1_MG-2023]|nr:hypothetical protein [Wenyingzhuangia sp. 1_MG-2023]
MPTTSPTKRILEISNSKNYTLHIVATYQVVIKASIDDYCSKLGDLFTEISMLTKINFSIARNH